MREECSPHVEFAYNRAVHSTTKVSPFQVVYGFNPCAPIDLLSLPQSIQLNSDATSRAEWILKLHELTKTNIEKMNAKYRSYGSNSKKHSTFEPGDLVLLHLRKDHFPELRKSKCLELMALLKFLRRSMTMHTSLSCLQISGLVPRLALQI